jgi:zinc transport system substrate-binding protein
MGYLSMNRKQKSLILGTVLSAIILVIVASAFFAKQPASDKLTVVATFYPLAFLSQEIGGENVQVTQLVPSNTEIHAWEPSASHIVAAEDADIIVYNGAGLDHWMEDDILPALSSAKTRTIIKTTQGLELLLSDSHEDPHTWISPYMAKLQAEQIYNALIQKDPDHESYYYKRWTNLNDRLEQLDNDYTTGLATKQTDAIFVSHEAFGYIAYRYGFEQHGVIGLSADEQPSATTIANIVDLMKEHETFIVYVDPVYSSEYTQTLKNELQTQTGHTVTILKLYLMLGPTDDQNLIQQMQSNLANLKIGLEAT